MRDVPSHPKRPTVQDIARQKAQLERLYMPAMPPLWLFTMIGRAVRRWRTRRAVRALLEKDDHILCDLGYNRAQLRRRLRHPQADERSMPASHIAGGRVGDPCAPSSARGALLAIRRCALPRRYR